MNPNNPNFRTVDEWFDVCAKLSEELEYYKEMELRYNELLDSTSAKELVKFQKNELEYRAEISILKYKIDKFEAALNRIGMLGMGELAYTSEFTEKVTGIVRGVLK